jgi:hypothetical protein
MTGTLAARFAALLCATACLGLLATGAAAEEEAAPQASLHGYSGLWDMPDGRVLPDWNMRLGVSDNGPYRSYHGAVGLFDRIEAHGRFTEIDTVEPFPGEGYGDFKDRSAGFKTVVAPEGEITPQIAVGATDLTGTAVFGSRYAAASKRFGCWDLTLGLGQGAMAGRDVSGVRAGGEAALDAGRDFLTSSPWRRTRPFAGASWRITPRLSLAAEYSSFDYENLYGFTGEQDWPINLGVKYALFDHLRINAALMRGRDPALGVDIAFPLEPEALMTWRSEPEYRAAEKERWRAYEADDAELAEMLAQALRDDGFTSVAAAVAGGALRVEARNTRHLSDARAYGRMGAVITDLAPERIGVLYLVIKSGDGTSRSLKCSRTMLRDYMRSRIDAETFMAFSDLDLRGEEHRREFAALSEEPAEFEAEDPALVYEISPLLKTFLDNRGGFFKHKAGIRQTASYRTWRDALATIEVETVLYNEYGEVVFRELEPEPVRTDMTRYESGAGSRITTMALEQTVALPLGVVGRVGWGSLETAYTGVGGELFRLFKDGRFGAGVQARVLRKRDPNANIGLAPDSERIITTGYLNLYALLIPEQGVAGGLKIGRFLAGDHGVRIDLSRTFRHFTLGAWYTVTDTGHLESSKNVGHRDKGVYVRVPFSIFRSDDSPGHFRYSLSSFTRDAGGSVRTPNPLYPMDAGGAPAAATPDLEKMRHR